MKNTIIPSLQTISVTSLNMIFTILPSAVSQSYTKSTHNVIQSSHTLIHPYKSNTNPYWNNYIFTFKTQSLLPLVSELYNAIYALRGKSVLRTAQVVYTSQNAYMCMRRKAQT